MEWWRCKHGAPTDPKWRAVGARINVAPGVVWAVFSALLDRASQAHERGSIIGYDPEDIAAAFGFDVGEVERTVKAFIAKGIIDDASITNWHKHQPKREDNHSTERVRAWRKRDAKKRSETQRNATQRDETHGNSRGEEIREEKKVSKKDSEPSVLTTVPVVVADGFIDLKKELFTRGVVALKQEGLSDAHARSLLGRWRRDHGDVPVIQAFASAQGNVASQLVPYITAVLQNRIQAHARKRPISDHPLGLFAEIAERIETAGEGG